MLNPVESYYEYRNAGMSEAEAIEEVARSYFLLYGDMIDKDFQQCVEFISDVIDEQTG